MYITLNKNHLSAAVICATKKDIRDYLNGVYIEFHLDNKATICGANGSILFVAKSEFVRNDDDTTYINSLIIPSDIINIALKQSPKTIDNIDLELINAERKEYKLGVVNFIAINGKFPDIEKIIPEAFDNDKGVTLNPKFLLMGQKSIKIVTGKETFTLVQNGTNNACVMVCEDANILVVVMPIRAEIDYSGFPCYRK